MQFVHSNRLVTSHQVARIFYHGLSRKAVDERLRSLYDLHVIDRFFPQIAKGSAPQHLILDYAGAKILGIDDKKFHKMERLPQTYRHYVYTTDFMIMAWENGFGWGVRTDFGDSSRSANFNIMNTVIPDVWYDTLKIAIEIDLGTEGWKFIRQKGQKYGRVNGIDRIVFVTAGSIDRCDEFFKCLPGFVKKAGSKIDEMTGLVTELGKKYNLRKDESYASSNR